MRENQNFEPPRRTALRLLLAAAAGAGAWATLPAGWSKPELVVGVLPAHAQGSSGEPVGCPGASWTGTLSWSTGGAQDIDLELEVPVGGGFTVSRAVPFEPFTGTSHSVGDSFQATITVPTGNLVNGTWTATVRNSGGAAIVVTFNFQISGLPSTNCLPVESGSVSVGASGSVTVQMFSVTNCESTCA